MILAQFGGENPFGEVISSAWLDEIEKQSDFWNQTNELQYIAYTAQERKMSAYGLLLSLQSHQASLIPPNVVLVGRNGKPGYGLADAKAISIYVALMAETGGGKSDIIGAAYEIIHPSSVITDGTGQGMAKIFAETKLKDKDEDENKLDHPYYVNLYLRHSAVMHAPEVDDLAAELGREGSKTSGTLRKMWNSEVCGSTTGDVSRRVNLRPNTYKFGGIWGIQPEQCGPLMAGINGGTPQRWTWAPAEEHRSGYLVRTAPTTIPDFHTPVWSRGNINIFAQPEMQMPYEITDSTILPDPVWVQWSPMMHVEITKHQEEKEAARAAVFDAKAKGTLTPEMEAEARRTKMESHLILNRIKLAVTMGWLHGRCNPTDLDWELAGIQIEVSKRCLAYAVQEAERAVYGDLYRRGTERGVEQFAARKSVDYHVEKEVVDVAGKIWQKFRQYPKAKWELNQNASGYQRKYLDDAMKLLAHTGIVNEHGKLQSIQMSADGRYFAFYDGAPLEPPGEPFTYPKDTK